MYYSSFIINIILLIGFYNSYELSEEKKKVLEEMIQSGIKNANLHSFGIIITNHKNTIFSKMYGENNDITEKTPFIIGSVSKTFTALSIYKEKIDINQTLDKLDYLKDYIDEEFAKETTISELLNHTSGLQSFGRKRIYTKGEMSYSNYGFALLAKILEHKSGKTYNDYLQDNIFTPNNMVNTKAIYREDIIESYDNFFGFRVKYNGLKSEIGNGFYIPAGYISSTIEDMGNYLRYYLKNYKEQSSDYYEFILPMIQKSVKIDYNRYYGSGMFVWAINGTTMFYHYGGSNSFGSLFFINLELDLGFFAVTNTMDYLSIDTIMEVVDSIRDFLVFDRYGKINTALLVYTHFFYDIIFILIIFVPITYLVITIIRKIKKKKYIWFIEIKGKIIFSVELLILVIIPIIVIIILNTLDPDICFIINNIKDITFVLFTGSSAMFLTFIIKLVYIFIYNKYFQTFSQESDKRLESIDLDYINPN
jgi:CubicO group peptidase (beta-lactamase class C family)